MSAWLALDGTQVVTSVLVAVPATIGAVAALMAARSSRRVNDAVNHRHPGQPTLKDNVDWLVAQQVEFQSKGWPSLPDEFSTAERLTEYLHGLKDTGEAILSRIEEHEEREFSVKYLTPEEVRSIVQAELEAWMNGRER